ncbi:M56 family metallopeptidase [Metabacillus sediminilitoris]|uniref:M56 family metallopeptidase n=1 Tax=Metabacillus sediminilitoris TaxID=2567941 RepID=A0A4S4BPN7_9BACI|nr:M56 family metallopeptidase [Metabacillus sediminilitoris]QGQ47730.1 M48 family metalloprotease [Metabacillus sediminilitoris]THF76835.1 M56 family metallopeptidase [Metabacillus sediminilitoris]
MWRYKSLFVLGLGLLFALILSVQMGMYVMNHLFGTIISLNIFQLCISLFHGNTFVYHAVLIAVNTFIAYTIFMIVKKVIQQIFGIYKVNKRISIEKNIQLTEKINGTYNRKQNDITIIDSTEPIAFTMGFFKPKIVLSSALITMLDKAELEAVIYHETAHQKYYDPLMLLVLQIISEVMWYIPLTRWSYENYKIMIELVADEYAIKRMGSELGLGSALLKLIKTRLSGRGTSALVPFANGTVDFRIKQLINPEPTIPVKMQTKSVFISINMIMILMTLLVVV